MTKRIFRSIILCTLLTLATALSLMFIALNNYFVEMEYDRLAIQAEMAATGINIDGKTYLESLTAAEYRVTWIAADGTVLFDSAADNGTMENHADREEIKEAILTGTGESIRYSSTLGIRTIYYAKKLPDSTVIRVAVERDTIGLMLLKLMTPLLWIVLVAFALASLIARKAAQRIVEPMNHMDLDHPLENSEYDEIAPLLVRIDRQNQQIDTQLNELRQKQEEFTCVTSSISEGLILVNKDENIVSINPAAMDLFRIKEDPTGRNIRTVCRDTRFESLLNESRQGAEAAISIGGRTIRIDVSPITSEGDTHGLSILAMDITDQYDAEKQRREFTANASHELKTPLQSIMGRAELLEDHMVQPADTDQFVHRIREDAARLLALIDDIIRLSQLDENGETAMTELNLKNIAEEVITTLTDSAAKYHVHLIPELSDVPVKANSDLVYGIIYNLADNAIRYNKPEGNVIIRTEEKDGQAVISVQDNGLGIPAESLNRIFERFYRVDKSHSRATGGTGLGLSIVKHAVIRSGGHITVESEEGKGSLFTVTLPR